MNEKFTNLYKLLGEFSEKSTYEELKKAYRKYAKEFHPDKNPNNLKWAEGKMRQLNETYEILSNPEKRKIFDAKLKAFKESENIKNNYTFTGVSMKRKNNFIAFASISIMLFSLGLLINALSNKN